MWFQDTLLFKQRHLPAKHLCLNTNQHSNECNVLYNIHSFHATLALILASHIPLSESQALCCALQDPSIHLHTRSHAPLLLHRQAQGS
jgi:hypothetical protein